MPRINVKDKRKQQLIDANIASIAKRGLSETTIAHVSQGAGMSRGIVNFYFTAKESMMQETCQYLADEYAGAWERAVEKTKGAPAEEVLRAIVAAHFTSALCSQKKLAVWVAFWGHASSQAAYRKIIAAADDAFLAKVAELWELVAKEGAVALSPQDFAYELHGLIRASWLNFLLSSQASDRETLAQKCQNFLTRALQTSVAGQESAPVAKKSAKKAVAADANSATVTEIADAKAGKTAKKAKPVEQEPEEQAALGDLFAFGG